MSQILKLRPADPDDEPFLRELRAQIDAERLGLRFWSPEEEALAGKIIDLQFRAHAAHYRRIKSSQDTKDCVIELEGKVVGRFILTQDGEQVHLADIAVHRDYRGRGLGQAVIEATQGECLQSKRVLRLRADPANPAMHLYLRLGFQVVETSPNGHLMEWRPPSLPGRAMHFRGGS
jgi:ribosomal protein S18 acetylase RimI-like enzyme